MLSITKQKDKKPRQIAGKQSLSFPSILLTILVYSFVYWPACVFCVLVYIFVPQYSLSQIDASPSIDICILIYGLCPVQCGKMYTDLVFCILFLVYVFVY